MLVWKLINSAARYSGSRQAAPELAFRKMRGMRNIVAHDYAIVDLRIVWEVATLVGAAKPGILLRHDSLQTPNKISSLQARHLKQLLSAVQPARTFLLR